MYVLESGLGASVRGCREAWDELAAFRVYCFSISCEIVLQAIAEVPWQGSARCAV